MNNINNATEIIRLAMLAPSFRSPEIRALTAARALAKAGLLMPDHPEPDHDKWTNSRKGDVYIRWAVDDMHLTPNEARALGIDLIASADEAEGNSHEL